MTDATAVSVCWLLLSGCLLLTAIHSRVTLGRYDRLWRRRSVRYVMKAVGWRASDAAVWRVSGRRWRLTVGIRVHHMKAINRWEKPVDTYRAKLSYAINNAKYKLNNLSLKMYFVALAYRNKCNAESKNVRLN